MILRPVSLQSPCRSADDRLAGRVDVVDRLLVEELRRHDLLHHLLDDRLLQRHVGHLGAMLRRHDDGLGAHRLAVAVLDGDLALAVGQQEGQLARLAGLGELLADAMRGIDGEGHVLLRLVAGVA
jgi:hypothetical protein